MAKLGVAQPAFGHSTYKEELHPRGPHGEWVKKYLPNIKNKTPPKSFKFYKQGYKPKDVGPKAKQYGKKLYEAKKAGHFSSDYEFWLAAQKLHAEAKKKHPNTTPTPHGIVNAAFHHEIADTGSLNMLDTAPKAQNVHGKTAAGVKLTSKFLAPGQLEWTGQTLGGVSGARVYKDHKGTLWIVKVPGGFKGTSKAYGNSAFLPDLDVATSRIQNKAGLPVPAIHKKDIGGGKIASVQKMFSRAKPAFPDNKVVLKNLHVDDVQALQQNMVLDWLLSNHDPHSAQFLKTDKGIVGIDKGQSFKYFGKDKLTPQFGNDYNPPLPPNVPVYSAIMKQYQAGQGELKPWSEGPLAQTIQRIQAIPDDEYKDLLRPYAEKAAAAGLLSNPQGYSLKGTQVDSFLGAAVARKNNLANDFDNLWQQLNPSEPEPQDVPPPKINPDLKAAPGHNVVAHPTEAGKFAIQKPGGEFSKNPQGVVKSWDTKAAALDSSTMAKYKGQAEQQAKAEMSGAQSFAMSAPTIKMGDELNLTQSVHYNALKTKIAAGEPHTSDEYLQLKNYVSNIKAGAKALGAAQVEHDFEQGGFTVPAKKATKTKGGFKEEPKFKKFGGKPPELSDAKGPYVHELGAQLWDMKKSGQIPDDFKMWSEAKKLATKDKKRAVKINPHAQSGVDYSSANQIRNVAMRLEYDETGDVIFETAAEKTSESIGQTVGQIKKTNVLHEHKPVVKASASQSMLPQGASIFSDHFDSSAPVGSYNNPHSFKHGATAAIRAYGAKYTSNTNWNSAQKSAWYTFTGSGSTPINQYFRTGDVGMFGNTESAKKKCKDMVAAFKSDNVKPLEDWTLVTRATAGGWEVGIGSDNVTFDQIKAMEGKVVRNKCPVSTSLRTTPAFGGSVKIAYKLPPGFRAIHALGNSAHSGEDEVILPPGMAYRILEVKKGDTDAYGVGNYTQVLVEVVDTKLPEIT